MISPHTLTEPIEYKDLSQETETSQQYKDECDITQIIKRAKANGGFIPAPTKVPQFIDTYGMPDYAGALDVVVKAKEAFMDLPPEIRKKFHDDPQVMLDFLHNPDNQEECYELGLAIRPEPEEPIKVQIENPQSPPSDDPSTSDK